MRKSGYVFLAFLFGCTGLEQSEQEKIRKMNERKELIYRSHNEKQYEIQTPVHRIREPYPWEKGYAGSHAKVTKEDFRCKGDLHHPPRQKQNVFINDCGGVQKHSLPVRGGNEFIYPILIDILNYLQLKTDCPVIITCGHRCPAHNTYADDAAYNQNSKHMIGAEVDFYLQGMEHTPEKVVDLIMQYYKDAEAYQGKKEYEKFARLDSVKLNVSTPPWYNQEVLIKLYLKEEGRDLDNTHPYPYLSLQVRYDRDKGEKVVYSWEKASHGYMRY